MKFLMILAAFLALALPALAETMGPIHVADAKSRPAAAGANGVVYMVVMNHGEADDSLTALSTPVAVSAEMHRTVVEAGVSRMDPVAALTIKAGDGVTFAPGGLHVMLTGLKQPLKQGDSFPLTLEFAKAGAVTVMVAVPGPKPATHEMPGMKM